ncbi:hypothetical protein CLOM_g7862 [Closterium sp. NIES-68]|nr:hypothetical protein CLOM_g7862 [Closterium sp. NIES-68]
MLPLRSHSRASRGFASAAAAGGAGGPTYASRRFQHQQGQQQLQQGQLQPQLPNGQVYPEEWEEQRNHDRAAPARKGAARLRVHGSSRRREWKAKNPIQPSQRSQRSQRRSPARYEGGGDQPDCFFSSCCCLMFVRRNRRPRSSCGSASVNSGQVSSTRRSQELARGNSAEEGARIASPVELLRAGLRQAGASGRGWVVGESDDDDGDYIDQEDGQPVEEETARGSAVRPSNDARLADTCSGQQLAGTSAAANFPEGVTSSRDPADVSGASGATAAAAASGASDHFPSAPRLPRGVSKETIVSLIRTAEEVGALRATESKDAAALLLAALEDISVPSVHRASSLGKIACSSGTGAAAAAAASAAAAAAAAAAATGSSRMAYSGSRRVACFPGAGGCVVPRSLSAEQLSNRSFELSRSLELGELMDEPRGIAGERPLILDRSMEMQQTAEMDRDSMELEYSPKRGGFDRSMEFARSTPVNGRSMEFNRTFEIKRSSQPPVLAEPNSKPTAASARGSSSAPIRPTAARHEPLSPLMLPSHRRDSFGPPRLSLANDSPGESEEGEETEDISVSRSNSCCSSNSSAGGGGSCEGSGVRCRAVEEPEGGMERDAVRFIPEAGSEGSGEESRGTESTEGQQFVRSSSSSSSQKGGQGVSQADMSKSMPGSNWNVYGPSNCGSGSNSGKRASSSVSSSSVSMARGHGPNPGMHGADVGNSGNNTSGLHNMHNMNSLNSINNYNRSAPLDFPSLPSMPGWPAPAKPRMASSVIVNARRRTFSRPHSPARAYSPRPLSPIASTTPTASGLGGAAGWAARRGVDSGCGGDSTGTTGEGNGQAAADGSNGELRRSYSDLERSWSGDLGMAGGYNGSGGGLRGKAWGGDQGREEVDGWEIRQQQQSPQAQQQRQDVDEDLYYYHLWQQQHKQFHKLYEQVGDGEYQQQEQQVEYQQQLQQDVSRARDGVKRHWRP